MFKPLQTANLQYSNRD